MHEVRAGFWVTLCVETVLHIKYNYYALIDIYTAANFFEKISRNPLEMVKKLQDYIFFRNKGGPQ